MTRRPAPPPFRQPGRVLQVFLPEKPLFRFQCSALPVLAMQMRHSLKREEDSRASIQMFRPQKFDVVKQLKNVVTTMS